MVNYFKNIYYINYYKRQGSAENTQHIIQYLDIDIFDYLDYVIPFPILFIYN